ncbi:MAG: pilin [Tahibacter sp.]
MMLLKRFGLSMLIVAVCVISACNRETATNPSSGNTLPRVAEQIARPAWLRERLPEHTIAYLRIPSFWGLLSAPNGRALDGALASEQHVQLIARLRNSVRKDPMIAATGMGPLLILLLGDLAAPVELAVIDGSDIANPASNVLISLPLDVPDLATLNARIAALGNGNALLKAPIDTGGKAALAQNGFLQFDTTTHRMHVLMGMAASASVLDGLVKQLGQTRAHPMQEVERQIDNSGQGLFFWMSLKGVNGMASAQLSKVPATALLRDFVDKSTSLAAGWGTSQGHGNFQVSLTAPNARFLSYFSPAGFRTDIKSSGAPVWAVTAELPTSEQWKNMESHLADDFGAAAADRYGKAMLTVRNTTGAELKDLIGLIGPELIAFEDASGTYSAVRVNDRAALYARLDDVGKRYGWRRETVKSGAATVQHLHIPGMKFDDGNDSGLDAKSSAWLSLYARIGRHLYWSEEGEFLVFGQVPQALADRIAANPDAPLDAWLRSQSYAAEHALIGATGVTHHVQRTVYYAYLNGLQSLADALGQPAELAGMPSASELKLPTDGAVGLSVDVSSERIGLRMTYEQTPIEALLGSNGNLMSGVAVAGIVAAIALPAYQDYTVRAQVATVIADARPLLTTIAEYHAANDDLPESSEDLELPGFGESTKYLSDVQVDHGALVLRFGDLAQSGLRGQTLILKPYRTRQGLEWRCTDAASSTAAAALESTAESTTVPEKWLPSACR